MSKTVIGKDVIESLTSGMYDDPKFIYREYIQNAADQIDKARLQDLVDEGVIYISIDPNKGTISIEDDATGIEQSKVAEILKNIAQSTKQRGVDKGFRGIGRLGGLGYCEKLVFETSFFGEGVKSIMTWDAKKLKEIIHNRNEKEEASDVIDAVTHLETKKEEVEKHYFKVSLIGVTNKHLLDVKEIRTYLSMVAPVPFSKSFLYARKIYDELKKEQIAIDEYNTIVNTEQLFKGYNSYIYEATEGGNRKKIGEVIDVLFFKEYDKDKNVLYWGWYGITEKNQSLNQVNFARGFRLRKANIQVGNEDTLSKLQKERRFQYYFFGEVYGLNQGLIPNARRDYFAETSTFHEFEEKLCNFFHTTIASLTRDASKANSAIKDIEGYNSSKAEFEQKANNGFINKEEKERLVHELEKKEEKAKQAVKTLDRLKSTEKEHAQPMRKIIERATAKVETTIAPAEISVKNGKEPFRANKLSRLNKAEQKFLGGIFTIIQNVLPKETAELLIQKIEEEYK